MFEMASGENRVIMTTMSAAPVATVHMGPLRAVVPPEVHAYSAAVPQMAAGRPGKVGLLQLQYEKKHGITRLGTAYHQAPLHRSRPLYLDPALPEMIFSYVISLGGGIIQGDRLGMEVDVAAHAMVHLTTQSATKVYRMEHDYAVQQLQFTLGPHAYLEWIPDPLIPYRNSRLFQQAEVNLHPTATLMFADMLLPGREGELFAFDVFYNRIRVALSGRPIISDTMCLQPSVRPLHAPGAMAEYRVLGTLYVLTPRMKPDVLARTLLSVPPDVGDKVLFGCTRVPDEAGVVVRCVGTSPRLVRKALMHWWSQARLHVLGYPAPARSLSG